jgi:hypothetical protein
MEVSRRSLAVAVTLSLLILCSGCAKLQDYVRIWEDGAHLHANAPNNPADGILPGTHLVTIPPGPSVAPGTTKP